MIQCFFFLAALVMAMLATPLQIQAGDLVMAMLAIQAGDLVMAM